MAEIFPLQLCLYATEEQGLLHPTPAPQQPSRGYICREFKCGARLQQTTTDASVQEANIGVIHGGPAAIGIPRFKPAFHLEILIVISPDVWFLVKIPGMPHNPQNHP